MLASLVMVGLLAGLPAAAADKPGNEASLPAQTAPAKTRQVTLAVSGMV